MAPSKKTNLVTETVVPEKIKVVRSRKMATKIDNFFDNTEKESVTVGSAPMAPVEPFVSIAPIESDWTIVEEKKPRFKMPEKKTMLMGLLSIVFLGLVCVSGYFYYQYKKITSADAGKNEIASYVSKIGKFMVLPEGEDPTMATVADKDKLSGQAFFVKAENGDKVLFYSKSQKAILYRPSLNKIIEATAMTSGVGATIPQTPVATMQPASQSAIDQEQPSSVDQETKQNEAAVETTQQATVLVNNGTSQKGLAKTFADKISQISGVTISGTGNAKGNFTKTTVVDVGGKNTALAEEIAKTLGGKVEDMPSGETAPSADILVIAGSL